jgi:hypothetical protein
MPFTTVVCRQSNAAAKTISSAVNSRLNNVAVHVAMSACGTQMQLASYSILSPNSQCLLTAIAELYGRRKLYIIQQHTTG